MDTEFERSEAVMVPVAGEALGDLLRRYRAGSGLTQEDLAARAGISARTISDVERGLRKTVYRDTAARMADALELEGAQRSAFEALALRGAGRSGNPSTPAAKQAEAAARLPSPLTRLIGRADELAALLAAVASPEIRLLTLVGPGGIGKTRLGIEVAIQARAAFQDGVFFVSLAVTDDPGIVPSLIAREVRLTGIRTSVPDALRKHFRDHEALLVLDTFEHVLPAAPFVVELAADCPRLTILVTSRAPLRIRGEHVFGVAPLEVPEAGVSQAHLDRYPATALFVERVGQVRPDLVIDGTSGPLIVQICRSLDGLPLALELAAVRLRHLPLAALQRQLDHRLNLLVGGPRDLPERQRTMRDTIGWSYDLLDAAEQSLFRQLSIFVGGWTLDAAEAICAPDGEADRLFGPLSGLVDNNLVSVRERSGEEHRYMLLDVVREFAGERAAAYGEANDLSRRHATFFAELAEAADMELGRSAQEAWYRRLEAEQDNMRAAMAWAAEHGEGSLFLRLAGALWLFWRRHGDYSEGRLWLDRALAIGQHGDLAARRKALWGAAWISYYQGDHEHARLLSDELLGLADEARDRLGTRNALTIRGIVAMAERRLDDAIEQLEQALQICREIDPGWLLATSVLNLGIATLHGADLARSQTLLEEAVRRYRKLGDKLFLARTIGYLGYASLLRGDRTAARRHFRSSLQRFQDLDERFGVAEGLQAMSVLSAAEGRDARAAELAGAANALWESMSAQPLASDRAIATPYLDSARRRMGASQWRSAWRRGRSISVGESVADALEDAAATRAGLRVGDSRRRRGRVIPSSAPP